MKKLVITIDEVQATDPIMYGNVRVTAVQWDPKLEARHIRLLIPKELWGQEALVHALTRVVKELG